MQRPPFGDVASHVWGVFEVFSGPAGLPLMEEHPAIAIDTRKGRATLVAGLSREHNPTVRASR